MKVQSTNSQHKREEVHKMVAGPAMVSGLEAGVDTDQCSTGFNECTGYTQ